MGIPTKEEPQFGCFEKDQAEALAKIGHRVVVISVDVVMLVYWLNIVVGKVMMFIKRKLYRRR